MLSKVLKWVGVSSRNERLLREMRSTVESVSAFASDMEKLPDAALRGKTEEFRKRLSGGEPLDALLSEAFATVREGARRWIGLRHYDVQLIGGIVLHQGKIAEMATGEGKTLVATLPVYLNALEGKGVHVVTVNDYLAQRDRDWMGPVYEGLGLRVGALQGGMGPEERREIYSGDIVYGTNSEFGFDYLRDHMATRPEEQAQRVRNYAIVDEVDSILIDEARTPLIISGPAEESTDKYYIADRAVRRLAPGTDFEIKEKEHQVILTEAGIEHAEKLLQVDSLYKDIYMDWPHHLDNALKAHHLYKRDTHYVVQEGEVVIVDEFTGRLQPGRRWSDGLHQAVEAKEGLRIKRENQTLATVTIQNFFRMYKKLAGMTGTAFTEAEEFYKIYKLDVVIIPANRPVCRTDHHDIVYRTEKEKWNAIEEEIVRVHETGRPILVGTRSIEKSELLNGRLQRRGIEHEVLNAKQHAREAEIVAKAGQRGNVTIATNMAGRGTDIVLGQGVAALGGLHVLATERHDARRIDNQLRGRCARQGDPGSARFFVSLEDDLMRIFAGEWVRKMLERLGMTEGQEIESGMVSRGLERAQKRVEEHHFEVRKNLLEYDGVMDDQRKIVYEQRQQVLEGRETREVVWGWIAESVEGAAADFLKLELRGAERDFEGLIDWARRKYGVAVSPEELRGRESEAAALLLESIRKRYDEREAQVGPEAMRRWEQILLLLKIDAKWKEHLHNMDHLRAGIGLRGYGQVDPKVAYRKEGFDLFDQAIVSVKEEVTDLVLREPSTEASREGLSRIWSSGPSVAVHEAFEEHKRAQQEAGAAASAGAAAPLKPIRTGPKVGRNDPCPCGSGKKHKKCCGAAA
jgi:preprotein translocase subunit SecA